MKNGSVIPGVISLCLASTQAIALDPIVYPNQSQSADQQAQDQHQCYEWSRNQSGFDPMAAPTATAPPPPRESPRVGTTGGAATGAVIGGIIGGSSDARTGAVAGGLIGGMRRSDQKRREQQSQQHWEQNQATQYTNSRNLYNRAYAACMEGRGYTVR